MKFQATVVLDLEASSIAEAGAKLNELVEHAKRDSEMDVQDVQLGTAPKSERVTLPTPMPRPERRFDSAASRAATAALRVAYRSQISPSG